MDEDHPREILAPFFKERPSAQLSEVFNISCRNLEARGSRTSLRGPSLADMNLQMSFSERRSSALSSAKLGSLEFGQSNSLGSGHSLRELAQSRRSRPGSDVALNAAQPKQSQIEALFNPTPQPKNDHLPKVAPKAKPFKLDRRSRRKREKTMAGACRCKASKCLKLYCECFAKNQVCGGGCHCKNCHNLPELNDLRDLVLKQTVEKNPYAFRAKLKRLEGQETLLHSRGCNCSKTSCIKNYCECFNAGIGCSRLCKCVHCKNNSISITDDQVKQYHERVLRKRRKKAAVDLAVLEKFDLFKKIKK